MFCDKHGTIDYCPDCANEEKESISKSNFETWWELKGSKMKNGSGENINDTELPLRIAREAWKGAKSY